MQKQKTSNSINNGDIDNPSQKTQFIAVCFSGRKKERKTKLGFSKITPDYCTESPDTELAFINVLVENTFKSAKAKDFEQNKQ